MNANDPSAAEAANGAGSTSAVEQDRPASPPADLEVRHAETLEPIASLKEGPMRMLGAAKLGTTRLIDNIAV